MPSAITLLGLVASLFFPPVTATQGAARVATVQLDPPPTIADPPGPCGQWYSTALDVGWDAGEWPTISRVMWCESQCKPGARNRSGASGLMQIMPMWWHGRDPLDPATNLTMALEVRRAQGWRAWSCYR
jgi:hypothetical protein